MQNLTEFYWTYLLLISSAILISFSLYLIKKLLEYRKRTKSYHRNIIEAIMIEEKSKQERVDFQKFLSGNTSEIYFQIDLRNEIENETETRVNKISSYRRRDSKILEKKFIKM